MVSFITFVVVIGEVCMTDFGGEVEVCVRGGSEIFVLENDVDRRRISSSMAISSACIFSA